MINGLPYYRVLDHRLNIDARGTGYGRTSVIGTCVHTTGGINSLPWLTGGAVKAGKPASADWLIGRSGERYALCPQGRYPYHAGQSQLIYSNRVYHGDEISQLLMGVELENLDSTLCTYEQLDSLAELITSDPLAQGWRWPYYVVGHYEIARPVGRRADPQGFLWGDFMGRLYVWARHRGVPGLEPNT